MALPATAKAVVCALRQDIAKIEGRLVATLGDARPGGVAGEAVVSRRNGLPASTIATGAGRFDLAAAVLSEGMTEVHGRATQDAGAVCGFALALAGLAMREAGAPLLWISTAEMIREAGGLYAPGLAERFGIAPERLLIAQAEKVADVLWIAEEAATLSAFGAVLLELRGSPHQLDLTATRRLHRRALNAGRPFFLLRHAGRADPTAAPLRLAVSPAAAGLRTTLSGPFEGSIGPPAFLVDVAKSRFSPPASFRLQWNLDTLAFEERPDEPSHSLRPADPVRFPALAAERPHPAAAARAVLAFAPAGRRSAAGRQP